MKIGLDIGGSHISIGVINNVYELIYKEEKEIQISKSSNPKETLYFNIVEMIEETIKKLKLKCIDVIGLAVPRNSRKRKAYESWKFEYR